MLGGQGRVKKGPDPKRRPACVWLQALTAYAKQGHTEGDIEINLGDRYTLRTCISRCIKLIFKYLLEIQ